MPRFAHFLYLIPLIISTLISLKAFKKGWAIPYRLFSAFLLATMVVELAAIGWKLFFHHTSWWNLPKSNLWIYNIYIVPEYLFYLLFFSSVLDSKGLKKISRPVGLGYLLFGVTNILFVQGFRELNTYTIIGGGLITVCCATTYFIQEFNRKQPIMVHKQAIFWISIGVLLFHAVSLPNFIFLNYLSKNNLPLAIALFNILLILNILMYSSYLIAFLCQRPTQKKSF